MLGQPSRRPLSLRCVRTADDNSRQQTADSRQQHTDGCADDSSSDARSPLWISQLTRTKANANLEWLDRFEGGVVSVCAPLRRCAAAPLRRCAAAPLRRCASLASRSPRALAYWFPRLSLASYREIHLLSNDARCRWLECHSSTTGCCTVHAYVHDSGRFVSYVVPSKSIG